MRSITIILLLIGSIAVATAQRMPFGITGRSLLVSMGDVKKELKLTKEQDKQIMKAIQDYGEAAKQGQASFDFMDPMAGVDPALEAILNDEQKVRLEQLFVQANGGFALVDKKVAAALKLTDEQKAAIKKIADQANSDALNSMRTAHSPGSVKAVQKKHDEAGDQMKALLTPEQATEFAAMQGKPFKFR